MVRWYGGIGRRYVDFRDRFVNGRIWILNQNTYHAGSSPATTTSVRLFTITVFRPKVYFDTQVN